MSVSGNLELRINVTGRGRKDMSDKTLFLHKDYAAAGN